MSAPCCENGPDHQGQRKGRFGLFPVRGAPVKKDSSVQEAGDATQ
ncbi:hypothetical protein [Hymenobacter negativus]|nr:hypothetical protein [Hymenobacter negativus]